MVSECRKSTVIPPAVESLLASCTNLPSLPSVVVKIIDASKDPDISLTDVADIIRVDPALSVKLLKVANSSLYARRRKITSLREALTLLGLNASLTIALSFSIVKSLNKSLDARINYDMFWKRSILSATIARQIGLKLKLPNLEDFFLASLLQDIGILAIDCSSINGMENNYSSSHMDRIHSEKNELGVDHSDVGAWLLKSWNIPEKLYKAVLCSHVAFNKPVKAYEEEIFYQCVGLSGGLADLWFENNRQKTLEQNFSSIEDILGFKNEEVNDFINEINDMLPEMSSLFEMNLVDEKTREQLISEARDILMVRNLDLIRQCEEHQKEVSDLLKKSRDIEEEASHDHLTGVYNRKYIDKLLNEKFNNDDDYEPMSLAFIDIDDFKLINDTYGHLAGDKVLQGIASFFTDNIRETDVVARYGGDEFLLLLPNTCSDIAHDLLKRLNNKLEKSSGTNFEGNLLKVSISFGMATHVKDAIFEKLHDLIQAADKELYNAKKNKKYL
ncbi:MAG: hypothetical protein DIZ80_12620 [endosymbiont of Galathealinum brachiosum]|uniref:diguanylate cyclase n=1 Tax=endosymbiont of Galathealinum brachiosum TaxID=2200906 RepID=A0A370DFE7_9GAMM|nr:MAG: hypothetical protein DIZ80_12620 [endosymbiont of Galathealinum brachiosum]